MKKLFIILGVISIFAAGCAYAAGQFGKTVKASGPDITGTIDAKAISEIDASQAIQVNYAVGQNVSVTYRVPESLAPYLDITCNKGVLKCKFKGDISMQMGNRKVVVDVVAPAVSTLEASSAAAINATGVIRVNQFDVEVASSGSVSVQSVHAGKADIECGSSGSVVIANIAAKEVDVEASSTGSVRIHGDMGQVDAEATSAATISITGSCSILMAEAESAGSIDAAKAKIGSGELEASSAGKIAVSKAINGNYMKETSSGGSIAIK